MSALKLLVLTIVSSILISGVINQAPTPPSPSAQMDSALDAIISGQCWRQSDLAGVLFSATATSRRAQAPTPTPINTCPADWAIVDSKLVDNNRLVGTFTTQFNTAMDKMTICLSRRRLQAPTPTPHPPPRECTEAHTQLATAFDTLGQTLMGYAKARALVVNANSVTIGGSHPAVTVTGNDVVEMAISAHFAYNTLRIDCGEHKLMSLPSARRAQRPTPPAPVPDATCNNKLATVLAFRATRISQVTDLLQQATTAACLTPTRRLRRILRVKYEQRSLQAPTPHYCDTAEKAVKLALACLSINGEPWTASSPGSSQQSQKTSPGSSQQPQKSSPGSSQQPQKCSSDTKSAATKRKASAKTKVTKRKTQLNINMDSSEFSNAMDQAKSALDNFVHGGGSAASIINANDQIFDNAKNIINGDNAKQAMDNIKNLIND